MKVDWDPFPRCLPYCDATFLFSEFQISFRNDIYPWQGCYDNSKECNLKLYTLTFTNRKERLGQKITIIID